MSCPFCPPALAAATIIFQNDHCFFLPNREQIPAGSGLIIPHAHRETPFDLSAAEWAATYGLLQRAKAFLDAEFAPDGYNIGWNCGAVGGQEVFHVHLHVIPRYADEPLAGKGIRYWIKQEANRRPRASTKTASTHNRPGGKSRD
jgi:diadenosine tetraphosphate (Ap4A) HIT family hydrolase